MISNTSHNNEQLWDSFRNGDDFALAHIYDAQIQTLFKYGSKLSNDQAFVMDCIQDVFVDIINNRTTIGSTDNIRFYLIRSLRNKMLRSLSKTNNISLLGDYSDFTFLLEAEFDDQLHEIETNKHQRRRLREAIGKLPERQKEAIYLRYIMDFKNEEIAKIMDINYQAVRNTLYKAIENLRQTLSREDLILFLMIWKSKIFADRR